MSIVSGINSSLQGMNRMQQKMDTHAHRISNFGAPSDGLTPIEEVNLPEEMVGMMAAHSGYSANLEAFRFADEMLGTLLDVLA